MKELKTSQKPFQFVFSRALPNGILLSKNDIEVSLEDYSYSDDAKNGMDITADIKLKQYKDYSKKTIDIVEKNGKKTAIVTQERPAETAPKINNYEVVKGDTLWNIAKKYYGDGSQYTKIAEANKEQIKSPNSIQVGQVLIIP